MNLQAALVRKVLENYRSYPWRVLGLGFISTELDEGARIHVWDSSLAEQRVSTVHTHSWHLHSQIISGELVNQRFEFSTVEPPPVPGTVPAMPYTRQALKTGQGGGLIGEPDDGWLAPCLPELYHSGQSYTQACNELHRTLAQDGTVTLIKRTTPNGDEEDTRVFVYWPKGATWGDAKPRAAEHWQVERAVLWALQRWHA